MIDRVFDFSFFFLATAHDVDRQACGENSSCELPTALKPMKELDVYDKFHGYIGYVLL